MGKRFTETSKWGDKWFRALGPFEKLGWQYLCDNCDAAGVIDLDRELADFQVGHAVEWDSLLAVAGERVEVIRRGKLWLTRFCDFQYGRLTEACRPHRPVMSLLEKHGLLNRVLEGYQNTTNTPKDKDKEKEQDKDKEKEGGVGETEFAAWWSTVPNKVGKQAAAKAYRNALRAIRNRPPAEGDGGEDPHGFLLARMLAFAQSPKARGQFCPHPATWLNEGRYDDDPETWKSNGNEHGRRDIGPGQRHDPATAKGRSGRVDF